MNAHAWAGLGVAVLAIAVVLPLFARLLPSSSELARLVDLLAASAAALFFGAGMLRLSRWRLTGEARAGLGGIALAIYGGLTFPLALAGPLIHDGALPQTLSPLTRAITAGTTFVLLALMFRSPQVDSGLRPRLLATRAAAVCVGCFLGLVVARRGLGISLDPPPAVCAVIQLGLAAGWATVAAAFARRARRESTASAAWSAASTGTLALAALFGLLSVLDLRWLVQAATFSAVAATVVLVGAASDLWEAYSFQGNRQLATETALVSTEELLQAEHERLAQQVHDARSVIAALHAATTTLARYEDRLDEATKAELRGAVTSELQRLNALIDPPPEEPMRDFPLVEALHPVIAAERETGLDIREALGGVRAHGHPADLARVVHNLLVNARRYAPGSAVVVRAEPAGCDVRICVADRGPGVAPGEREAVFRRGVRGTASRGVAGSGLGLYTARRLVEAQGGRLDVEDRPGGGAAFVVTLPAGLTEALEGSVEVGQIPHRMPGVDSVDVHRPHAAFLPGQRDDEPHPGPAGLVAQHRDVHRLGA